MRSDYFIYEDCPTFDDFVDKIASQIQKDLEDDKRGYKYMLNVMQYMRLAYPFDLTLETSSKHGEIIIKMYDDRHSKTMERRITLYEVHNSKIDLIESNITIIKNKMLESRNKI